MFFWSKTSCSNRGHWGPDSVVFPGVTPPKSYCPKANRGDRQSLRSPTELNTLVGSGLDASIGDSCDAVIILRQTRRPADGGKGLGSPTELNTLVRSSLDAIIGDSCDA